MTPSAIEQAIQIACRHQQEGRWAEAEQIYRQVLVEQPENSVALRLLGTLARQMGRLNEAVDLIGRAIRIRPQDAYAHNNLGNALKTMGRVDEAIASYRAATGFKPDYAEAHYNLGIVLQNTGKIDQAIASYRQTIRLKPDLAAAHNNLGSALKATGHLDQAIESYRKAIGLKADYAEAHFNLGNALHEMGGSDQAIESYRQAIRLKPGFIEAYCNLGSTLKETAQFDEAVACIAEAIRLRPDLPEAHNNLGSALDNLGQIDEAIAAYRQALGLKPTDAAVHSNLLLALVKQPAGDPRGLLVESRQWDRQHAEPLKKSIQPHPNARDPGRRLRIGYVSPDFREHSVSRFVLPLLAAHDREAIEVFAYAQVPIADKMTARLKSHCDAWRDIAGLSDERVAETIRQDQIDILIDLAGHTSHNRLLVFARKLAPVQATWLGYPGTTGLSAMDYRLTDGQADPPGLTDGFCSEQLIRLPRTGWCFQPPDDAPAVSELPAIAKQHVTFGSFNNLAKVNESTLKLWAKILHLAPGARLLLKSKALGNASAQQRVRKVMAEAGVEPDRIELLGWVAASDHPAHYGRVDIALDTYPYHGTATTCESFWMGVPVVSLAGESHVSRVGVSLLSSVGLAELIARTPEEYVKIAVGLAGDLPRLAEMRRGLRSRMEASVLMDGPSFARDVEAAYRQMWRNWCSEEAKPPAR
jgi:protein O-GlcNAc transferase